MRDDIKNALDLNLLKVIFLFANTPHYLYMKFSENQSIQMLSSKFSLKELIREFFDIEKQPRDFENFVYLYSLLIALSFGDSSDVERFLESLKRYEIEWLKEIKDIIKANIKITHFEKVDGKFEIKNPGNRTTLEDADSFISIN